MSDYCYITFPTTYFAIRSEKTLNSTDIVFKMLPVPRSISSSCGTALRCFPEDLDKIKDILSENNIECEGFYHLAEEQERASSLLSFFKRGKNNE